MSVATERIAPSRESSEYETMDVEKRAPSAEDVEESSKRVRFASKHMTQPPKYRSNFRYSNTKTMKSQLVAILKSISLEKAQKALNDWIK
jgi:hypothetical protein